MKQNQQQTIVRIIILEVSKIFEGFPSVAWSLRKLSLSVWRPYSLQSHSLHKQVL